MPDPHSLDLDRMSYRTLCAALFCVAVVGCSDDAGPIYVIGGDTSSDTQVGDTTTDAPGADAGDDVDLDAVPDVDIDAPDAPFDGGADAGDTAVDAPDATEDGGADTSDDVSTDTTEDTAGDTDTDVPPPAEVCDNERDDDEDGDVDCDDDDCADHRTCVAPGCGNGVLDDGEDCEDGNTDDDDGCASDCSVERGFRNECGDGVIVAVAGEECDDGDANSDEAPDACRTDCVYAYCGDDVVDAGESCDGEATCDDECEVIASCGDGAVQEPEECDDGNDNPGDGCDACLLTAPSSCGDGVYAPAFEECEGGRGCTGADVCTTACVCEAPEFCGNGTVDSGEECDGSDAPCGANGFCNACACEDYVCGNNVREGTEECDGSDDSACGGSETCVSCACTEPDVAPRLDAIPANPVTAGAVTHRGWDTTACPDRIVGLHRVTVRLTGRASAALEEAHMSISSYGIAQSVPISSAAGDFDVVAEFCLPVLPEGDSVRMLVTDTRGRESSGVNFTFPTLRAPTLTDVRVYTSRDGDAHVIRLVGNAVDRNISRYIATLEDGVGGVIAADFNVGLNSVAFNGTQYTAIGSVTGVFGAGVATYDGHVQTFGLQESGDDGASVSSTSGSGGACVPADIPGSGYMCTGSLVCGTTGTFLGTCRAATGGAPVLTSVLEAEVVADSDVCGDDFPDEFRWRLVGSTSAPIQTLRIQSTAFGEDEFEIGILPIPVGPIDLYESICISGAAPTDLRVRLVDEANRVSVQRTASFL